MKGEAHEERGIGSKGLSEEHAQIVMEDWNDSMKGMVLRERMTEASDKLKEANKIIEDLKKSNGEMKNSPNR